MNDDRIFRIFGGAILWILQEYFQNVNTLTLYKSKWKEPTSQKSLVISDGIYPGESSVWVWLFNDAGLQSVWELTCIGIVPDGCYGPSEPVLSALSRAFVRVSAHMLTHLERISLCFLPLLLASRNIFIICPKWEHFQITVISLRRVWVFVWRSNIFKWYAWTCSD